MPSDEAVRRLIKERFGELKDVEKERPNPPPLTDNQRKENREKLEES